MNSKQLREHVNREVARPPVGRGLRIVDELRWGQEELAKMVAWHKAANPALTATQIDAFTAAFLDGYRKGAADARLHLEGK